jgi:DnaJ-class molecular chaperone
MENKRVELCPRCGGCGSNTSSANPGKCPNCEGKGYVAWSRNMISPSQQIRKMQQQEQKLRMDVCGNGD